MTHICEEIAFGAAGLERSLFGFLKPDAACFMDEDIVDRGEGICCDIEFFRPPGLRMVALGLDPEVERPPRQT